MADNSAVVVHKANWSVSLIVQTSILHMALKQNGGTVDFVAILQFNIN